MKGKLEFIEDFGNIEFTYEEPIDGSSSHYVSEIIPERIVKQGERAIKKYVKNKIREAKKEWRKWESFEDDIKKNHIPIQTKYGDGTTLEGRIVEATSRYIKVRLDKPLKGSSMIHFGFASAMAGHYVFAEGYKISQEGYNAAKRALGWAYSDAKNKPKKDLVNRLNNKI